MIFTGIDPGLSGAVVSINENNEVVDKVKTPTIKNSKGKNKYNVQEMVNILKKNKHQMVILEFSQAFPGQGIVSMHVIGLGYGLWEGILAALEIPYLVVHPKTWQKEVLRDYDRSDTKQASVLFAGRMFPTVDWRATERCKKIDNNLTDAVCMAVYAKMKF